MTDNPDALAQAIQQRRDLLENINEINALATRLEIESRRLRSRAVSLSRMVDEIEAQHGLGKYKEDVALTSEMGV